MLSTNQDRARKTRGDSIATLFERRVVLSTSLSVSSGGVKDRWNRGKAIIHRIVYRSKIHVLSSIHIPPVTLSARKNWIIVVVFVLFALRLVLAAAPSQS